MTLQELREQTAIKLGIHDEKIDDLNYIVGQLDTSRLQYFQKVIATEEQLSGFPRTILTPMGNEVQVSEYAVSVIQEYSTECYYLEHEEDEIVELSIDIETFSSVDLTKTGVYKYAEAPDFRVLLFAYSVNRSPVRIVDVANGEKIPQRVVDAVLSDDVKKTAYNAAFERVCLSRHFGVWLKPDSWQCTMVMGARLGLPMSLMQCGLQLHLSNVKMKEGAALIKFFSMPCRATRVNGGRTRNLPEHDIEKWATFKRYCIRDVEVEQAILSKVERLQVSDTERRLYILDQNINDRGIRIDLQLAQSAADIDAQHTEELMCEARNITGLSNPNSVTQLKEWLRRTTGVVFESFDKKQIAPYLERVSSPKAKRMLDLRSELGKTSISKYTAMLACACKDSRARGLFQFYGARTGRWTGRNIQIQNLPQSHISDLDYARDLVRNKYVDEISMDYGSVPKVLSELIRTALIPADGHVFHVCDFSAIEARVIAWLADEQWVLDVFNKGRDLYCETASKMFGVPVEKGGINGELRAKGKIATLALGYGGGASALKAMGGDKLGLDETEINDIVQAWRKANPKITRLWRHTEQAAKTALEGDALPIEKDVLFKFKWGGMSVKLPSGREIFYPRMYFDTRVERLKYEGANAETKVWGEVETYGGKLTENIVQAIARDILAEKMLRLDALGYKIVAHVHDEVVIEATPDQTLQDIEAVFAEPVSWAKGLPLKGSGFTTRYYKKD